MPSSEGFHNFKSILEHNNLFNQYMKELDEDANKSLYTSLRVNFKESSITDLAPLKVLNDLPQLTLLEINIV